MHSEMFCFQCEQTAGGKACTVKGVCGKESSTANLQDELTGVLVAVAKAAKDKRTRDTDKLLMDGLFTAITNVNFDDGALQRMIAKTREALAKLDPAQKEYPLEELWGDNEDIRSLKSLILFGIRGMAAYAYHAAALGYTATPHRTSCLRWSPRPVL